MPSPANSDAPSVKSLDRSDALFQVRLLAALRTGDPSALHPFLAEIGKSKGARGSPSDDTGDLAALILHLAIRCASYETIAFLLDHRSISPNSPYPAPSKVSPLHLAASLGRADVVSLLLSQESIDDTVKDAKGRSVQDVATEGVQEVLRESRRALQDAYIALLHTYITSPRNQGPSESLLQVLNSPRVKSIDVSAQDPGTGTTILHEAARRNDLRLIELAVRAGADVFVRDRRGRSVSDAEKGQGKEQERVKAFLRQFTNRDTTLIDATATQPPALKGYLNKYTNVARGYSVRWFVLQDGVLSYYRNQDEENLACRGSISMRTARFKASTSDKLRFEVSSISSHSGSTSQKWYMRAEHPVEVARWIQAIRRNIEWYTRTPSMAMSSSSTGPPTQASRAPPTRLSLSMSATTNDSDSVVLKSAPSFDTRSIYSSTWKSPKKKSQRFPHLTAHSHTKSRESVDSKSSFADESGADGLLYTDKDEGNSGETSESDDSFPDEVPPHQKEFSLHANSMQMQIELTTQLLASFSAPMSTGTNGAQQSSEVEGALQGSLAVVGKTFEEYKKMVLEREDWYKRRLAKEKEKSSMWEDSLGVVVGESEGLERDLLRLREEKRHMRRALRASMLQTDPGEVVSTIRGPGKEVVSPAIPSAAAVVAPPAPVPPAVIISSPPRPKPEAAASAQSPHEIVAKAIADDDDDDDESGDEFFDAIESGNGPAMVVPAPLINPPVDNITKSPIDLEQYEGYKHPRERLPIDNDNRPPVSLWAVLKGSIGKDLTKISFPVFFNEPTSMLQRMAEDMEFTECLDAAVAEKDPHKRIAFVAAFAMSNYSSTIGRIAKPFNPMLGETFEYCRLDRQYRYVSEQVSHHPPISACWAESPSWNYYGEVDAKNKFMGKSFEIRPTGVAHADLKLPKSFVERARSSVKYSPVPGPFGEGKVLEHYSWKKVTTNVSGFIVGSPTIDHYGDMTVTNHATGDRCVLTFKPRGWRAATACEIKGYVTDASGKVTWEIAGRWSSQLVARRAGSGSGDLLPDVTVSGDEKAHPEYLLLWRNTEKPHMPFNLTPYAITLNDCPETTLKPYLPPTDCRLRPDQRAFENGEYERANTLKMELEDFQRATRRKRESGQLPPHKPRWFEAGVDTDTGERVWKPLRDGDQLQYWAKREKVYKSGDKAEWVNVDKIFGDIA